MKKRQIPEWLQDEIEDAKREEHYSEKEEREEQEQAEYEQRLWDER